MQVKQLLLKLKGYDKNIAVLTSNQEAMLEDIVELQEALQGVSGDLEAALEEVRNEMKDADDAVLAQLTAIESALTSEIERIEREYKAADTLITAKITAVEADLAQEVTDRETAIADLTQELSDTYNELLAQIALANSAIEKVAQDCADANAELKQEIQSELDRISAELGELSKAEHTHKAADVTFETDMLTVNGIGGIGANEDLNGLDVNTILTKLIYPYVAPVVNASSNPNGATKEFGDIQNVTNIRASVTKKSEKITKIEYKDGNSVLGTKTEADGIANGGNFDLAVSIPVSTHGKKFSVTVTDASNKTYTANTGTFNFYYPYFYGTCAEDKTELTAEDIKAMAKVVEAKGNKTRTYTTNNERFVIAYPKAHGTLRSIIDPNNFDITASFARAEISITGLDGTAQQYYVYVSGANTNTNFALKFNY